ncbi:hypothetical protein [Clostridium estertheticum]|uniref:hypothetical protein n=1 Tax=Clostridium estertheticum TaxID=238834 RepID=UPI001C7D1527|nr:hypothetical protein [Clostridium estertheticum]MBX4266542.1 hypothetical protein [Clostridium estertheticum]WLC88118.1 hypothetical protein KTC95_19185 [Clostridium estertheticum]
MSIDISIGQDLTANILKSLKNLEKKNVCVGIPQKDNTQRQEEPIKNAELLFIHTNGIRDTKMIRAMQHDLDSGTPYSKAHEMYIHANGSPLWHSPPRPVIEPAIENDKTVIASILKEALIAELDGNSVVSKQKLNEAGLEGQAASQDWFTNPDNKWAKNSPGTIKRKKSDMPLIDTGELRKSITYIIDEGDSID